MEFIASTDSPFAPIEDVMHSFHFLRVRLRDIPEVVGNDRVLFQRRKGAEDSFFYRRRDVDVLKVTTVPFGLFSNPHVRRSIKMVEDGGAVLKKSDEKFLHRFRLWTGECRSERTNRIPYSVMDMFRRGHEERRKKYADSVLAPFSCQGFSSLLSCRLLALCRCKLSIQALKNGCLLDRRHAKK